MSGSQSGGLALGRQAPRAFEEQQDLTARTPQGWGKQTLLLEGLEIFIFPFFCNLLISGHALGNTTTKKASGGDGIPVELFQILKDDAVKVLHSICQQIGKTQQCPQDWKRCFHSNPKEGQCQRMFKLPHNFTHLTC